ALSKAIPERIPAASAGSMNNLILGGQEPHDFVYYETIGGGSGAGPEWNGSSATQVHMTNTLNTPIEAFEHAYPVQIARYGVCPGSGGSGRNRGGDGIVREYRFLVPTEVTFIGERHLQGPYGLAGGANGQPAQLTLVSVDGTEERLPSKVCLLCQPGQQLRVQTAGGGGYGKPGPS
ncbi:MAG: hydantoinase B/oxoprolinase family protein, partial [Myxococcales bacterium]|nr:hydantoinase B/oxoprolinase family protein [Myxococcales bacterium]